MHSSSSRIQALLKGFLLDKIQQVDHSFQNIVTDYIKRSSAFQSFKDGRGRMIRADGLDFYRAILDCCRKNLSPGGIFLFEIGFDQKEAVTALAKAHRLSCLVYRDFGGNDRVAEIFPDGERGAADGKAVREEDEWEGQRGKRA